MSLLLETFLDVLLEVSLLTGTIFISRGMDLKFVDLVWEEKSRCCSRVFHCPVDG